MGTGYAMDDDDNDINAPVIESEDLSGETSDVLPRASNVLWTIKKLSLRKQLENGQEPESDSNKWKAVWMDIGLALTEGIEVDGELKYAGRFVFDSICVQQNKADFPKLADSTYYSRAPYTQFLRALEFDLTQAPRNDKEFREDLIGQEIRADVLVKALQDKVGTDDNGKAIYSDNGDYKNVLKNFRQA